MAMKIAILGAGAMGCLYASYLAGRHEVTVLDNNKEQVEAIRSNGIIRREKDGSYDCCRVKAVAGGTDIGIQDLIIIFVKSIYTREAVRENQKLAGPETIVMTLQNGAGNNRDIASLIPRENIIVGTSSHNSVNLGGGEIFHSGCGPTNIGPDFPCDRSRRFVARTAEALQECGLSVFCIDNIQEVLWKKLFVNCGLNALSAIMECKIGMIKNCTHLWEICTLVVQECVAVARKDGTAFSMEQVMEIVGEVAENDAAGYTSMYQDRFHKRKTEIDKINGVVVALGKEYHVETPYNRMLVDLVHAAEECYA